MFSWSLRVPDHDRPPTLIDAKGRGGTSAIGGFDYQLWDGLIRLPSWLSNPAFEELIFEGIEDLEVRFFAPHAPREKLLDRYQAKSGHLTRKDICNVLQSFYTFDVSYPKAARVQTLVTQQLPQRLSWLSRDGARVRDSRPFYCPFPDVIAASNDQIEQRLVEFFGVDLGKFAAESVEVEERNVVSRDAAMICFSLELREHWAIDAGAERLEAAFAALEKLVRRSIGKPIGRDILRREIENGIGVELPLPLAFPLHVRSDCSEASATALEIDAREFSGESSMFPPPSSWERDLVVPLRRTARWLRGRGISRMALSGSYRLTTAMVIGWAFRSAVGFEMDIAARGGPWSTDNHVADEQRVPEWDIGHPEVLYQQSLVISVGVLRDPARAVVETLGVSDRKMLRLNLSHAILSGAMAQASVSLIKRVVDDSIGRLRPKEIQLYMAVPAFFAVALGHRWNALPTTRLHEYRHLRYDYVETAVI